MSAPVRSVAVLGGGTMGAPMAARLRDAGLDVVVWRRANAWVLSVVQGAAEALALAQGLGLDPQLLFAAVGGGPLDQPYLRAKGGQMVGRDFTQSFALRLAAKDARLVADTAERVDVDAPAARAIADRFAEAAREHGDEDLSATFHLSAPGRR